MSAIKTTIMINLFFSYSHRDENLRNELDKHLSILKRNGFIDAWHDRCILPGSDIDKEISNNLKKADIILLLISSDFIASDYCYDNEMKYAMEKHNKEEAVIIPVILRPCDWQNTPFGKLLATPTDGKPVIKYPALDDAFLEITTQIKKTVNDIIKRKNIVETISEPIVEEKPSEIRSSNLRIRKKFADQDKDEFLDEAFEYIANYFEGSLKELTHRNPETSYRFKRVDSQTFTANIYVDGKVTSECMIYYGTGSFSPQSISYSRNVMSSKNSYNESFHLQDDGYNLFLIPSGMSLFGRAQRSEEKQQMTNEGAAEYFWEMFIEPLQRNN